jgi:hypothetical protein
MVYDCEEQMRATIKAYHRMTISDADAFSRTEVWCNVLFHALGSLSALANNLLLHIKDSVIDHSLSIRRVLYRLDL